MINIISHYTNLKRLLFALKIKSNLLLKKKLLVLGSVNESNFYKKQQIITNGLKKYFTTIETQKLEENINRHKTMGIPT